MSAEQTGAFFALVSVCSGLGKKKNIRQYEYENFLYEYKAYKALHGNSFIERIAREVAEWEIVT